MYVKAAARDIRSIVVHTDVVANNFQRQTTSGFTSANHATIVENPTSISGYQNNLTSTCAAGEGRVIDSEFSRDWNWNRKSTDIDINGALNDIQLLPGIQENDVTSSNTSADSSNNKRLHNDDYTECHQFRRVPAVGKAVSGPTRLRPHSMVIATAPWMKPKKSSRNITVLREVAAATCACHRTEVVCAVVTSRDEGVLTTGSTQSDYSGIYERDLDEILESVSDTDRRPRRRRAAFPSSQFYFRLPSRQPEIQSYRSSSSDSCYGKSDSENEWEGTLASEDDLESDESPAVAVDRGSFYRRLNRFRFTGNCGPEMAAIEP